MRQTDFLDLDEGYVPVRDSGGTLAGWRKNICSTTAGVQAMAGRQTTCQSVRRLDAEAEGRCR